MYCEVCNEGIPEEGEDICESCLDEWAEDERRMMEAERRSEIAYLESLELPSITEPLDEWEEMRHYR